MTTIQNNPQSGTKDSDVVITRVFDAPREQVFKAWTDPEQVEKWWSPKYFTCKVVELDVRPGGAFLINMLAPDNTVYPNKGRFQEIVEPELLVMLTTPIEDGEGNPQMEVLNTVTFEEENGKTKLTLRATVLKSTPIANQALAGMEEGWNGSLDKLDEAVRRTSNVQ